MNSKLTFKTFLFCAIALTWVEASLATSQKHGKVRARERTWHATESSESVSEQEPVEESFDSVAIYGDPQTSTVEPETQEDIAPAEPRIRRSTKHRKRMVLIGGLKKKKKASLLEGYLAVGAAPILRFSDIDPVNARPPSPALPEFNFVSSEYVPYLIEEALPEDARNDNSMLSELVIEMEPHTVVSGTIDTRRHKQEEQVEHFQLEEQRTTVLRPEEVLIFFETDTSSGSAGAIVPFSPATPNTTTIKSSATLKKE